MKRKADFFNGQPSVKKPRVNTSADVFRSKIAAKLLTFLDTSLNELNQEKEESDDLQLNKGLQENDSISSAKLIKLDEPLTKSLLNFIDTAKTRFSELFNKENKAIEKITLKCSTAAEEIPKISGCNFKSNEGSLQAQISKKLHSLLKKTLDKNGLQSKDILNAEERPDVQIIEEKWKKDVSVLFENFVNCTRKKFDNLLWTKEIKTNSRHKVVSREKSISCNSDLTYSTEKLDFENRIQASKVGNPHSVESINKFNSKALNHSLCTAFEKLSNSCANSASSMEFETSYEPKSFEEPITHSFPNIDYGTGSGILLMDEAQHAPDVLNLEVILDEQEESEESSSEPEVLCLGEKVPTYEVVTIEEDDEPSMPTEQSTRNTSMEKSFDCSHCGKSYKVESLLKFHVRMHGPSFPHVQLSRLPSNSADSDPLEPNENGQTFSTSQHASGQSKDKKKQQKSKHMVLESRSKIKFSKKKHSRQHKHIDSS